MVVLADGVLVAVGVSGGHHLHGKGHRERGHRIQRSDGAARALTFSATQVRWPRSVAKSVAVTGDNM